VIIRIQKLKDAVGSSHNPLHGTFISGYTLLIGWELGGMTMAIARPLHMAAICAAFLFIGAVVLGAL
jgi:hypothetical protein